MTETLLALATPVFTVGGEVSPGLGRDCVRLEVCEGVEGLRTLEAHFMATGLGAEGPQDRLLHLDGSDLDFGVTLEVSVGPDETLRTVFEGVVSGLELVLGDSEPARVVAFAEDALMRMRMTRRMRSYREVTDEDIARQLAQEHGLDADVQVHGPRYDVVQQVNQSDLAFLRERARRLQAEIWVGGRTLHVSDRSRRQGTKLSLTHGNELLTVRLTADLAHQRTDVAVSGYDARAKDVIDEHATGDAILAEAGSGRTGPEVLEKALGASTTYRVREAPLTTQEAQDWARAEMLRRARRFVTVTGTTRGSPDMVVGSLLRLELVGAPFKGDGYYVTKLRHTYDVEHGLRTHFEAERATINASGGA